jgi:hypothetical protein
MPGHFTHIYTARRVADHLLTGQFPDWPKVPGLKGRDPVTCGKAMQKWEKFTAIGAIGPDLFYFCQDWNNDILGPVSDELMLAIATYYFIDASKENDWEPLLIILDEAANSQLADLLRFLIKLQKIWRDFVDGWNATVGPMSPTSNLIDGLTGVLSSSRRAGGLKVALKVIAEEELTTFADIFSGFDTVFRRVSAKALPVERRATTAGRRRCASLHQTVDAGHGE